MYLKIASLVFLILSAVAFLLYALDKSRARRGKWRISEKALLTVSIIGGAVGGSLAMLLLRHKTKHRYFVAVNALGVIWQAALVIYLAAAQL